MESRWGVKCLVEASWEAPALFSLCPQDWKKQACTVFTKLLSPASPRLGELRCVTWSVTVPFRESTS